MISGWGTPYREAIVRLSVRDLQGREQVVEAVIDTGFNGYLTLPPDIGSSVTFDIHEAVVLWDGRARRISVDAANATPLLGMGLLYGHELRVQVIEGGEASIRALPIS